MQKQGAAKQLRQGAGKLIFLGLVWLTSSHLIGSAQAPATARTSVPSLAAQPVETEMLPAFVARRLLSRFMPPGARMSSGFRSATDQVEVIRQYAKSHGVPVPAVMRAADPATWQPALAALRELGLIIAAPGKSPHASEEYIVMDWARANLGKIKAACLLADAKGLVRVRRTIEEVKNGALHVELELTSRGCDAVGIPCDASAAPPPGTERELYLRSLREEHDSAKGDLERQIELDRQSKELTDATDFARQRELDTEIAQHQAELERLDTEFKRKAALDQIVLAKQEDSLDKAVELAERYARDFRDDPEAKDLAAQIRFDRMLEQVGELVFRADCVAYEQARELLESAAEDAPERAKTRLLRVRKDVEIRLSNCRSQSWLRVVLGIGASLVLLAALYFGFRQTYLLEVIAGPGKGTKFPLKQNDTVIGSVELAEEDGELVGAEIVINDPKHRISREHCRIQRSGRQFYLIDESANGTLVNGAPLKKGEPYLLNQDDEISLAGAAELLFRRR